MSPEAVIKNEDKNRVAVKKSRDLALEYGIKQDKGKYLLRCAVEDKSDMRGKADFSIRYDRGRDTMLIVYERKTAQLPDFHPRTTTIIKKQGERTVYAGLRFQLTTVNGGVTDRKVLNTVWIDGSWNGEPVTDPLLTADFMLQPGFLNDIECQKRHEARLERVAKGNGVGRKVIKAARRALR